MSHKKTFEQLSKEFDLAMVTDADSGNPRTLGIFTFAYSVGKVNKWTNPS